VAIASWCQLLMCGRNGDDLAQIACSVRFVAALAMPSSPVVVPPCRLATLRIVACGTAAQSAPECSGHEISLGADRFLPTVSAFRTQMHCLLTGPAINSCCHSIMLSTEAISQKPARSKCIKSGRRRCLSGPFAMTTLEAIYSYTRLMLLSRPDTLWFA
jgi:hypothetical protein